MKKSYVTCNSSNIIYLITCSNCFIQYVIETAQQLNIRFATHRARMSGKVKSNSCKWLAEHFSTGICKNASYPVEIIENGKAVVELVMVLSTLAKHFLRGREKQNGYLS